MTAGLAYERSAAGRWPLSTGVPQPDRPVLPARDRPQTAGGTAARCARGGASASAWSAPARWAPASPSWPRSRAARSSCRRSTRRRSTPAWLASRRCSHKAVERRVLTEAEAAKRLAAAARHASIGRASTTSMSSSRRPSKNLDAKRTVFRELEARTRPDDRAGDEHLVAAGRSACKTGCTIRSASPGCTSSTRSTRCRSSRWRARRPAVTRRWRR